MNLSENDYKTILSSAKQALDILKNIEDKTQETIETSKFLEIILDILNDKKLKTSSKKINNPQDIVGLSVLTGSPGYPYETKIESVKKVKTGWEVLFADDSFTTLSSKDMDELLKRGEVFFTNVSESSMAGAHDHIQIQNEELKFSSVNEAFQYLANFTKKKVLIAEKVKKANIDENTKKKIKQWMVDNVDDFKNSTELAEEAAFSFDLYEDDEFNISEDIFDLALDVYEEYSKGAL